MASAVARAYNGGLGAEPPAEVQGAEPPVGGQGGETPWSWSLLDIQRMQQICIIAVSLVCSKFKQQTIEKPIGE